MLRYPCRPPSRGACLIVLLLAALHGCAGTPQSQRLIAAPPDALPASVELSEVPFFAQQAYQCGPAALATLLNHQDRAVTAEQLTPSLYIPRKKGSLQIELLSNTRRHGLIPYELRPSLVDLFKEIDAGRPVLVFQNLALDWYPKWHYAVLIGYDLNAQQVVLRSGEDARRINSLEVFERTWARADHWAMVALQPGELPASVEYWPYLKALAGMEEVGKYPAARAGYEAGLARWPADQRLLFGLSNSQYALGEVDAAQATLERLIASHPDYAPAYNNLAQISLEQGRLEQAEAYALRAVQLGGGHLSTYRQTLQQIRARR